MKIIKSIFSQMRIFILINIFAYKLFIIKVICLSKALINLLLTL